MMKPQDNLLRKEIKSAPLPGTPLQEPVHSPCLHFLKTLKIQEGDPVLVFGTIPLYQPPIPIGTLYLQAHWPHWLENWLIDLPFLLPSMTNSPVSSPVPQQTTCTRVPSSLSDSTPWQLHQISQQIKLYSSLWTLSALPLFIISSILLFKRNQTIFF